MPATLTKSDESILRTLRRDKLTGFFAKTAYENFFHVHRGTSDPSSGDLTFIFGNDSYGDDPRSRLQVAMLLRLLRHNRIGVHGFGVHEECTWALQVDSCDDENLHQAVWYCWFRASGNDHRFAESVVGTMRLRVPKSLTTKN